MGERATVLIVDDQSENITLLVDILQESYSILAAIDGESALALARSDEPPDIILLDVMMPEMDGYAVCSALKADPATRDIPVIFITALADPEDETKGFDLGAVDYITKPISPPVVSARIRTHLQLMRAKELLVAHNEELEALVEERTLDVVRMERERVEGLQLFSNAVAHQIRNPAMVIGGMAGLLARKMEQGDPLQEYVGCVLDESFRLETLVSAISEYVQLSSNEVSPVSVKDIVDQAIAMARQFGAEMICTPEYSIELEEATVMVDEDGAVKAVAEILQNSFDFAGKDVVHISIGGHIDKSHDEIIPWKGRYVVRICDDGPGIDEEHLPYLLDPFFTTKAQGVGMGLTKARRIICEETRCSLTIESRNKGGEETGVIVSFDLPLADF